LDVELSLPDFLEEPTIAALARLVARGLASSACPPLPPLVRVSRDGPPTASYAQQRLWFLNELEPGRVSYHIPATVRLEGQLDISALERALSEVVRRHDVLRTTLIADRGIPRQVVADRLELPLVKEDLSRVSEDERQSRAVLRMRELVEQPFDLARGPLVRAALLRLGDQEHIANVTMHHAISDGWSIGILIRELSTLYEAFRLGTPSPLAEPAIQYTDYAVWQHSWIQGERLQAQIDYWTAQLAGVPHIELPTDRQRPPVPSEHGGARSKTLPNSILESIRSLGRVEGATLYMTLLAAFQVLLHRYSGQDDIAVGSPIAGRTASELEGLIGLFVNTLVLRSDLSGDPPFRELLRQVRRTAVEAYRHQDVPFEKLVNITQSQRHGSRSPLFQVMFALQNVPQPALRAPELVVTPLELPVTTSKFDLTLFATEVAEGLRLTMEYSTDLFDAATVDRMLVHYQTLLAEITADPDQPIGAIPMLTAEERRQVLADLEATASVDFADDFEGLRHDESGKDLFAFSDTELAANA
jgi:hypothetical protein